MERYFWFMNKINLVMMSVIPNFIYRFNAIPIKIPLNYFVDIDKLILQFIQGLYRRYPVM